MDKLKTNRDLYELIKDDLQDRNSVINKVISTVTFTLTSDKQQ